MKKDKTERLKRRVKAYVEYELECYPGNKDEYDDTRDDIIDHSAMPQEGSYINSRNSVHSPTEDKSIKLVTNKRLRQLEHIVLAINKTLDMLEKADQLKDTCKKRVIEMRYFERKLTPVGIALELGMSERTVYNYCDEFIKLCAAEMGLINIDLL